MALPPNLGSILTIVLASVFAILSFFTFLETNIRIALAVTALFIGAIIAGSIWLSTNRSSRNQYILLIVTTALGLVAGVIAGFVNGFGGLPLSLIAISLMSLLAAITLFKVAGDEEAALSTKAA